MLICDYAVSICAISISSHLLGDTVVSRFPSSDMVFESEYAMLPKAYKWLDPRIGLNNMRVACLI